MNQVLRQLGGKICHFDGAMGTMLQERGLLPGESPELWGLAHREEDCANPPGLFGGRGGFLENQHLRRQPL